MSYPDRKTQPPFITIEKINLQKPELKVIQDQIPVYYIKGGSKPIVRFEFLFRSGSYQQDKPLQAYALSQLLRSGTTAKSQDQINQLLDFYGVSVSIDAQKDIISVGFFCLEKHFEKVIDVFLEFVTDAVFPQRELDVFLKNKKQKHILNQKKVQHAARVLFNEHLFGQEHPYGKIARETDFDQLTRNDLIRYYEDFIHPGNCICFVSGQFSDNLHSLITDSFKKYSWKGSVGSNAETEYTPSTGLQKKLYEPREDALQSALRIGNLSVKRTHPDYDKITVTNTLLGGFFGSRLMRNIRQEKGFTYGISSAVVSLLRESYFFVSSQVGKHVAEDAIKEIYKEIRELRSVPATDAELLTLKNYISAGFLRSFDGPFMQMERFREALLFEFDHEQYNQFLPTLNQITSEEIMEIAEKYFHEDSMIEVVVG